MSLFAISYSSIVRIPPNFRSEIFQNFVIASSNRHGRQNERFIIRRNHDPSLHFFPFLKNPVSLVNRDQKTIKENLILPETLKVESCPGFKIFYINFASWTIFVKRETVNTVINFHLFLFIGCVKWTEV